MSRLEQARDAVRPAMKARLLLGGPPGSGKTRTALVVATALAEGGKPLYIDTEEESALTYADDFAFHHLPWHAPFDPRELAETLIGAGNTYPVVVVDSLTHFWRDEGGTLDIAGGKFTGWKAARPAQRDVVKAILRLPVHVIVCVRSKVEYTQVEKNGRQTVEKLGMAHEQDDSLEYEVNVSAEMDMEHRITIAKTRCKLLADKQFAPGERHAAEMAQMYADWLKGGEPLAAPEVVGSLTRRMDALQPADYRKECKGRFVAEVGRPNYLRESQVDTAAALVASFEAAAAQLPQQGRSDDDATAEGDAARPGASAAMVPPATTGGREASEQSPTTARAGKGEGPAAGAAPRTSRPTPPASAPTATAADKGEHDSPPGAGPSPAGSGSDEGVERPSAAAAPPSSDVAPPAKDGESSGGRPAAAGSPSTLSDGQRKRLMALCNERGLAARQDRLDFAADTIGRPLDSFASLTGAEARAVIDAVSAMPFAPTLEGTVA